MKSMIHTFVLIAGAALLAQAHAQEIHAVTTIPDLADFVAQVGGDLVEVESLASGTEDMHRVPAKPWFLVKLARADLFFQLGNDAEEAWVPALLEQCHNARIQPGKPGFVNCSWKIEALEVPESLDRSQGMLHPRGNPHFNVDPYLGRRLLINVAAGLIRAYPQHEERFKANFKRYADRLAARIRVWDEACKGLAGKKLVSYHRAWSYLAKRYGFEVVGEIESKPGIPPTPGHLKRLVEMMRARDVKAVICAHYYSERIPQSVAQETGAKVYTLALMVGGLPGAKSYIDMIDTNLATLLRAFDLPARFPEEKR